jgi:hypothetical protein
MAANQAFIPAKQVQEALLDYHRFCGTTSERQWNLREQMRKIDLAYLREEDLTLENWKAKMANQAGDSSKVQNVTIPVVKPQVNSAVDYQISVFLTDYPIFGVTASPAYIDQALQLQALIEENSVRTGWTAELTKFFFDAFKYWGAIECTWDKVVTAAIETDIGYKGGQEGRPKEIIWQGNRLIRWDPYNTYFDNRCAMSEIPDKADFAGHTELFTRTALKAFINKLDTKIIANIDAAFNAPSILTLGANVPYGCSYYIPQLNLSSLVDATDLDTNEWMGWAGLSRAQKNGLRSGTGLYEVSTEYVRIIPSDFGLRVPAPNTPQVWKLIWVNHHTLIYAERQTNAHEKIPVFFAQPGDEGLAYQSKSLAEDAIPFQQTTSALMNSVLAARRRAVTDRMIYDPSRILEAHINNPNPAAKIPIRPSAYGKPVQDAVYQIPFRDDQSGIALQEIQQIVQFGNILNGQNSVRQGQFVKGNKTNDQWADSMSAATSKDQRTALIFEATLFTPIKEVLKLNYLQYQQPGTIYSPTQEKEVAIDPLALRKAVLNFKVTDGLLPKEKVISTEAMKIGMQVISSSPQLAGAYNIGPMFAYLMKTENVNFAPFQKSPQQQAYEQALGAWNQVAMAAAQKGVEIKTPMPVPQQFGYDPQMQEPAAQAAASSQAGAQPGVQ